MVLNMLFDNYDLLMDSPNCTVKMRKLFLQLAVQGKLVDQDSNDEPASELLKRIKAEKEKRITEGKIRKQKLLKPITEDEIPYGIPESWTWIRLEEVFYPISVGKKKIKTSEISEEGPCPVIDQGQSYIAGYTNEVDKLINISGPVIIFGDHTCELKLINFDFVAGADGVKVLRPIEIYENYFFLVLKTLKIEERGYSRHYKYFLNNLLPLPPLAEQERIVAKVDQLMQLCDQLDACQKKASTKYESLNDAALERLLSAKKIEEFAEYWQFLCNNFDLIYNDPAHVNKLRRAILQLAVQGKLAPQDPNDEPASVLLEKIAKEKAWLVKEGKIKKQKPLPDISKDEKPFDLPAGWEFVRLQETIDVRDGTHDSPKDAIGQDTYPLVTSKNFDNGTIKFDEARRISAEDHFNISKRSFVERYDILFSMIGGNLGNQVMVIDDRPFSVKNVALFKYYDRELTSPFYIKKFMEHLALDLQSKAAGGAQPFVSLGFLRKLVIAIPPVEEQRRIVAKVDELMSLCDTLKARLNDAQTTQVQLADAVVEQVVA